MEEDTESSSAAGAAAAGRSAEEAELERSLLMRAS
jgi:hypothetical protein